MAAARRVFDRRGAPPAAWRTSCAGDFPTGADGAYGPGPRRPGAESDRASSMGHVSIHVLAGKAPGRGVRSSRRSRCLGRRIPRLVVRRPTRARDLPGQCDTFAFAPNRLGQPPPQQVLDQVELAKVAMQVRDRYRRQKNPDWQSTSAPDSLVVLRTAVHLRAKPGRLVFSM